MGANRRRRHAMRTGVAARFGAALRDRYWLHRTWGPERARQRRARVGLSAGAFPLATALMRRRRGWTGGVATTGLAATFGLTAITLPAARASIVKPWPLNQHAPIAAAGRARGDRAETGPGGRAAIATAAALASPLVSRRASTAPAPVSARAHAIAGRPAVSTEPRAFVAGSRPKDGGPPGRVLPGAHAIHATYPTPNLKAPVAAAMRGRADRIAAPFMARPPATGAGPASSAARGALLVGGRDVVRGSRAPRTSGNAGALAQPTPLQPALRRLARAGTIALPSAAITRTVVAVAPRAPAGARALAPRRGFTTVAAAPAAGERRAPVARLGMTQPPSTPPRARPEATLVAASRPSPSPRTTAAAATLAVVKRVEKTVDVHELRETLTRRLEETIERRIVEHVETTVARELAPSAPHARSLGERIANGIYDHLVLERERLGRA